MQSQRGECAPAGHWTARPASRRRILSLSAAGLAAGLLACGRKTPTAGAGRAPRTQAATPRPGGVLRLRTVKDFFDFDTSGAGKSSPNSLATTLAYETLINFRRDASLAYDDMQAVPRLAASWETPDAQTFTFHLRRGVRWANLAPLNGRPLTSADIKWSFEYASRTGSLAGRKLPKASYAFLLEGMTGIQTPNDQTIMIQFDQPYAPFVNYNYDRALQIVPHEIFDADGNFSTRMVGTGPFQLDRSASQPGNRWVFKKNPDYWQSGQPYLDEIDHLVIADDASAYAAFQAGQLDILPGVLDAKAAALVQRSVPTAGAHQFPVPSAHGVFMNEARAPFNDPRMRRAVALSVDHAEFDSTFGAGKGHWPATCALPGWFSDQEVHGLLPYDPAQAKQLLAAAGYPNGLVVEYLDKTPQYEAENLLLQAQLKKVGVTMNIAPTDAAGASTALHTGKFTLYPTTNGIEGDIDYLLFENYYSKSTGDYTGANDPKLDSLLMGQRRETDPNRRLGLLKDISRYMTSNSFQLDLYYPVTFTFWAAKVGGYADHWQQDDFNAPAVWLRA